MPGGILHGACRDVFALPMRCWEMLDQRFPQEEEAKYQKSLDHHYYVPVTVGATIAMFVSGSSTYQTYSKLLNGDSDDGDYLFQAVMVLSRLLVCASSVAMIMICMLKRAQIFPRINLERTFLAWVLFVICVICWLNAWHGCRLFGKDPFAVFGDWDPTGAEGAALLVASTVITGTCLVTPVRTHLSWIVPAFGMLSYLCATLASGSAAPSYLMSNLASLVVLMNSTLYGSHKNEVHLRREWLAQRKVSTQQDLLQTQYDGVCRILNLLCDCMIRLDSDLQFLDHDARFASMLMSIGKGKSLAGTCISDHIPDTSEWERFSDTVTGKQKLAMASEISTSRSGMFHMNFRDACGTDFPVDIYHTRVANKEDIEYLVGIVENRAREPAPATGSPNFDYRPSPKEHNITGLAEECKRALVTSTADETRSSNASAVDFMSGDVSNLGEVAVDILADPMTGFPIVSCTQGFLALTGPITEGEQLSKFIVDGAKFNSSIENMLNVFYNSCQNVVLDGLVFRKPQSRIQYEIKASSLDFAAISLEDESKTGSDIVIRASFHGIHQHKLPHRSRRLQFVHL